MIRRRLDAALDALFAFLARPRVARMRRWSFVVTLPLGYALIRWRGLDAGLTVVAIEFVIGLSVLAVILTGDRERRAALLDLVLHPAARRAMLTEFRVLTTIPRRLALRRRTSAGVITCRGRSTGQLAVALALAPAIVAETAAVHLLLPDGLWWLKLAVIVVSVYSWLWVVSLALGPGAYPHTISDAELHVRLGPLYEARIALEHVTGVAGVERKSASRRAGLLTEDDGLWLTPDGHVDVEVRSDVAIDVDRPFGAPVATRALAFCADDPAAAVALIGEHLHRQQRRETTHGHRMQSSRGRDAATALAAAD